MCQVAGFLELSEKPRFFKLGLQFTLFLLGQLSDIFATCVTAVVILAIDFVAVFIHHLFHLIKPLLPLLRFNPSTLFWDYFIVGCRAQLEIDLFLMGVCRRN